MPRGHMAELARNSWFSGLPWGASGYAHVDGPLAFIAPLGGVYGLSLCANALAVKPSATAVAVKNLKSGRMQSPYRLVMGMQRKDGNPKHQRRKTRLLMQTCAAHIDMRIGRFASVQWLPTMATPSLFPRCLTKEFSCLLS